MKDQLLDRIQSRSFPCIMAKAVARTGIMTVVERNDLATVEEILDQIYQFVDKIHSHSKRLSSFILILNGMKSVSFKQFEEKFWAS